MTSKEAVRNLLQKLVEAIISAIDDVLAKGTLQPHYRRYFRWKLTEFEYGDNGITKKSGTGEEFLKPFWSTNEVFQKVSKLEIYSDTHKAISEHYYLGEGQVNDYLETLITKVAGNVFERRIKTLANCTKEITSFLKDLDSEKQEYRAEVQLHGLILQPDSIQLDESTRLRKPTREDFEKEVPLLPFGETLEDPTAFLHTRVYAEVDAKDTFAFGAVNKLRKEIEREIAVFRLFRVGAVRYTKYTVETDSIIESAIAFGTAAGVFGSEKYLITSEDIESLKTFWSSMKKVELPDSAYPHYRQQKEPDELSIAYERYSDSLEARIIEKRISSAVMGLEALYLSPSERQELTFKLSMRVGKLLSQTGYSAEKVRKELTYAYDIRSTYVHGKTLTQKQKNRYEKKVGELGQFSKMVMDYLRASIVAWLERPSKTFLIQKIDDSFLDSKKEEEIKKLLFMPYYEEVA